MEREFARKQNNYKSYRLFLYFAFPFMLLLGIFPIVILFTQEMESNTDKPFLIGVSLFLFALTGFSYYSSRKQLNTKKSYLKMMNIPILTLTDTHLIYKFDELEQYIIPWKQITNIEKNNVSERFKDKLGYISISCNEEFKEQIKKVRKESYLKDQIGDVIIFIMYFNESLDEVYSRIVEFKKAKFD